MKIKVLFFLLAISVSSTFAAPPPPAAPAPARRMKDLRGFPLRDARRMLPKGLDRSLEISPIEAYVVARARIYSQKPAETKIIHEEADGAYDQLITAIASNYRMSGFETTESRIAEDTLTFHLIVFGIKDGKLAVLIPHSDDARLEGYRQYGDAWIGILKNGTWTRVNHPAKR